jgi:hypothetical protein
MTKAFLHAWYKAILCWLYYDDGSDIKLPLDQLENPTYKLFYMHAEMCVYDQGRRNWGGGQEGQPPPLPFTRRGKGGKGALSILKDCLGEIANFQKLSVQLANCSELSVQFFYEFASENARNAVIELRE